MKHKKLNRDGWGFQHFPYYQLRIDKEDFHGIACLIRLTGGEYQYWETPKAGKIAVCGERMTWLELIPDRKNRVITIKYFPDGTHGKERENYPAYVNEKYQASVWYVDVTDGIEYAEDGTIVYIDKYLDVIFTPEGDVVVDDRDELDAAYEAGEITLSQYEAALEEGEAIVRELTEDIPKTEKWCAGIRDYVEQILLEQTKQGIRQEEIDFPRRFASFVEKDYGVLYYMDENKDSYDGNHAWIYPEKIGDLGTVLDDIYEFYQAKGIHCSIYHPFVKDYFKDNQDILMQHGYRYVPEPDHRVMILSSENQIGTNHALEFRALTQWDERVANDILIPSGEPWEVDVTRDRLKYDGSYLFVGYLGEKAVVYSDIHVSEHGNTRFDYIVTAKEYRGKGYASELLSFIIEFCKKRGFKNCWQWAGPSEHICYRAGFRESFTMEAGWAEKD